MEKGNITNNNRANSTPSPPIFRSPAHGYSKSILSAIKGIPYEPSSGDTSRSSANSSAVKSPLNIPAENVNQNVEHGIRRAETTILKIKVGKFNEDEVNKTAEKTEEELTTTENKKHRERRSISCDNAIIPTAQIDIDKNEITNLSRSIQKTQSVNMINMVASSSARKPFPFFASPLPGCSIASSRVASTHSIQSTSAASTVPTPTNEGRIPRSPSAASSYCSKEDKSTTELPKIPITIFIKALNACSNGKMQELHQLVGEYPELITYQYPNCLRLSCLHIVAKAGDIITAKFLLKSGANVNAKDDTWATPLHFAAKAGQLEMVRFLREKGADSTIRDAHGHLYTAYLPAASQMKQLQSATLKPPKTNKQWDFGIEEDLGSNGGHFQHSLTLAPSRFNHSFSSFRKPISRVRDLLCRK